jgi:hypothetical protein
MTRDIIFVLHVSGIQIILLKKSCFCVKINNKIKKKKLAVRRWMESMVESGCKEVLYHDSHEATVIKPEKESARLRICFCTVSLNFAHHLFAPNSRTLCLKKNNPIS